MVIRIEALQADITTLRVDAIVNAANERMLGGGGVDGAIHRAAGPKLFDACRAFPEIRPGVRCPTGEAKITPGFELPAQFVIHTAGPVWQGGSRGEAQLLAHCYRNSLAVASENEVRSIAFPAISTGVYGYPLDKAAEIAVHEVNHFTAVDATIQHVIFACFDRKALDAYRALLGE
ncbi:MAG TPA: O-acetyl-ADP-ribose deacetylase [Tepidisphaeraceae bacterium]|nr:O-acetyl-ADP-ribose deacetylase [Tepidisphaeraceae bacterium]